MNELKPCPFCGVAPKLSYDSKGDENWIACDNDHCDVAPCAAGPGIRQVTESWNKRCTLPEERTRDAEFMAWARRHAPTQLAELITRRAQMSQNGNDRSQPQRGYGEKDSQ